MRWNDRHQLVARLERLVGLDRESVIQDVDVPIERAAGFLDFLLREVGVLPIWLCPVTPTAPRGRFPLFRMPARRYVNLGFWDVVRFRDPRPSGAINRAIERRVAADGGIKSLYSASWFDEAEFWSMFDGESYAALKAKYDPEGELPGLYEKCVGRGAPSAR
jgi:FAD/FMN-containing dehydrogenase